MVCVNMVHRVWIYQGDLSMIVYQVGVPSQSDLFQMEAILLMHRVPSVTLSLVQPPSLWESNLYGLKQQHVTASWNV